MCRDYDLDHTAARMGCAPGFLTGPYDFKDLAGLPPSSPLALFSGECPAKSSSDFKLAYWWHSIKQFPFRWVVLRKRLQILAVALLGVLSAASSSFANIVQSAEPSFWDEYTWRIIAVVALCLFEALIIGLLLASRARRRRAERETERFALLAEAERRRLEDLVKNVPGSVWEMRGEPGSASQSMDFVSNYIQNLVGYTPEEWLSTPQLWLTILHEDDREWMPREFAKIFASGKGGVLQCRFRAKDGQVVWLESHILVTCNEAGEPVALRGVSLDITERKKAEEDLRLSETRFREMADTSEIFIWIADTDMLCTYFNQRILDFTGRSLEELLGEGWLEIIHEDDRQRSVDAYAAGYERKEPFVLEFRMRRADGEFRWIYDTGAPRFATNGEFLGYIGSAVDIHDRKRAEGMLRKIAEGVSASPSELLGSLARRLGDVLGVDFVFVGRVVGDNHQRVKTVIALMDGEIRENIEYELENTPCEDVMKYGSVSHASNVQSLFPLDQQLVEMEVESYLGIALRDTTGQPFGLVSVMSRKPFENIGTHESLLQIFASRAAAEMEREQAEESLQQTQSELAHVARVMVTGELAATIAHEVNQPLTAVVANANATRRLLANGNANLAEAREAIDDIIKDAHRASEVVGRIRSLVKKEPRRSEPLAINEVIAEVVAIVRNELVAKKVSLRMEMADGLPKVEADRVEIQQVMINLMMNAVEAMRNVQDRSRTLLIRTAGDASEGALVEVQDSGRGIAPEDLDRIFDAFYTTRPEGMGLGLSICRTIIEAQGGRLWAESSRDKGSTFRFTLSNCKPPAELREV